MCSTRGTAGGRPPSGVRPVLQQVGSPLRGVLDGSRTDHCPHVLHPWFSGCVHMYSTRGSAGVSTGGSDLQICRFADLPDLQICEFAELERKPCRTCYTAGGSALLAKRQKAVGGLGWRVVRPPNSGEYSTRFELVAKFTLEFR